MLNLLPSPTYLVLYIHAAPFAFPRPFPRVDMPKTGVVEKEEGGGDIQPHASGYPTATNEIRDRMAASIMVIIMQGISRKRERERKRENTYREMKRKKKKKINTSLKPPC